MRKLILAILLVSLLTGCGNPIVNIRDSEAKLVQISNYSISVSYNKNPLYVLPGNNHINLKSSLAAKDPTYKELIDFIKNSNIDSTPYSDNYQCGNYAQDIFNEASISGIKSSYVQLFFDLGRFNHAINGFNTTDKGLIFIDCTNYGMWKKFNKSTPIRLNSSDKLFTLELGKESEITSIDTGLRWETLGTLTGMEIYW